jgi:hypothetical protein
MFEVAITSFGSLLAIIMGLQLAENFVPQVTAAN